MNAVWRKNLFDVGEIPPLGFVPRHMYAWTIRPDRQGRPQEALREEIVDVPSIGDDEALVLVMAAGLNYNGVWACLGVPVSVFAFHAEKLHIPGSDASGIVWAVGRHVRRFKVGDEVIIHCHQDDGDDDECNGGDPMNSATQRIWGYETSYGSFAQFTKVQSRQLMPKPRHLTWEESSCYTLTLATAYRMLFGHPPHTVKPGSNVLIWGAAGGLGSMAIQLSTLAGANAIAVIGDERKRDFVANLGARGAVNRNDYRCWGKMPDIGGEQYATYLSEIKRFGAAIRRLTGDRDPDIVFEHPGAETFSVSSLVCKRGGMVVFCASTTGFKLSFDSRFAWTRQKRLQGSHFANCKQASDANLLVLQGRVRPCLGQVYQWRQLPQAHEEMLDNKHAPGNHSIRVSAH
jgi:crotonyl-CoA carboxylase/reductase